MCTDHQHGQRRCRCCDPEARRAIRRTTQLRERGWDGDVDEVYAAGTVQERAALARTSPAATFDRSPTVRSARARRGLLTPDEQATLAADDSPRARAALAANPGAEHPTYSYGDRVNRGYRFIDQVYTRLPEGLDARLEVTPPPAIDKSAVRMGFASDHAQLRVEVAPTRTHPDVGTTVQMAGACA